MQIKQVWSLKARLLLGSENFPIYACFIFSDKRETILLIKKDKTKIHEKRGGVKSIKASVEHPNYVDTYNEAKSYAKPFGHLTSLTLLMKSLTEYSLISKEVLTQ